MIGWKRAMDVGLGSVLLAATLPLVAAAALLVLALMGRPVLFRQMRMGRFGQPFRIWKLRSMRAATGLDGSPLPDADRLTRLGRLLRASSIDELPSLVQVLKGEMSLVGPRPLPVSYRSRFTAREAVRLEVRPGLTGLAQVNGRNALSWRRRLACDVLYVKRLSPGLDLAILVRTVPAVLLARGVSTPGHATSVELRAPTLRSSG